MSLPQNLLSSKKTVLSVATRRGGLLDYYYKFDSVGIIYWPDLTVIDTGVCTYDDDGNETLEGGSSTRISSFGEGNGSIVCNP